MMKSSASFGRWKQDLEGLVAGQGALPQQFRSLLSQQLPGTAGPGVVGGELCLALTRSKQLPEE